MIKYLKSLETGEEVEQVEPYHEFVERLFAKRNDGIDGLMDAAIGISGEAWEVLDSVKKCWVYGKDPDYKNLVEELGYIEFYMQALRSRIGVSRDFILQSNVDKLNKRYPQGYTDKAAIERADKIGEHT